MIIGEISTGFVQQLLNGFENGGLSVKVETVKDGRLFIKWRV